MADILQFYNAFLIIFFSLIIPVLSQMITSPRTWSVDDVAKLVEKTDLKDYVELFRENVSATDLYNFRSFFFGFSLCVPS